MASNEIQINKLLDRLHAKTVTGSLKWERAIESRRYQTRIGEYVVQIADEGMAMTSFNYISLTVRKLSGGLVEHLSTSVNALNVTSAPLNVQQTHKLKQLYELVSGGNSELEDFLKTLG